MPNTDPKFNQFEWNELSTKDMVTSQEFYTKLFGWTAHETWLADQKYIIFKQGAANVAGMMRMSEEWGKTLSHWISYISVEDVDQIAERVEELGGNLLVPPTDVPEVGRFAILTDLSGAMLGIIKTKSAGS